jgi:exopolysaccharide production protein ExoZ
LSTGSKGGEGRRVESLDTLRGIAILVVIAFHVSQVFQPAAWVTRLTIFGNQGVQLFFVISAITMSLMWQQRAHEPQRRAKFYVRRFFRIAPLFILAIVFYTLWEAMQLHIRPQDVFTWQEILLTASFLHGFSPDAINKVVPGGWSIADEMNFYVIFPLLVYRSVPAHTMLLFGFLAYLVLGIVATTMIEHWYAPPPIFLYYSLLTQFPIFPIGIALYGLAMKGESANVPALLAIAGVWLAVAFFGKYALALNARPFFWLQMALIAGVVFIVVRRELQLKFLSYIGGLSYSMYLLHFAVIDVVRMCVPEEYRGGTLRFVLALLVVIAATTAVGKLSSITLEAWSARVGRRVVARIR